MSFEVLFLVFSQAGIDQIKDTFDDSLQHQLNMMSIEKNDRVNEKVLVTAILTYVIDENLGTAPIPRFIGIGVTVHHDVKTCVIHPIAKIAPKQTIALLWHRRHRILLIAQNLTSPLS